MDKTPAGILYIVSTPIGNLQDVTLRALETLQAVNLILAEDTRHTGLLLQHYKIATPMLPFHEYNEKQREADILARLKRGKNVALVSDAGTPLISDPGYKFVRSCIENNIRVEAIPGAVAAITALTVSGLPPDKFLFVGFLPEKPGKRERMLKSLIPFCHAIANEENALLKATLIFYESPYHLLRTLKEMETAFGNVPIVIARKLTK